MTATPHPAYDAAAESARSLGADLNTLVEAGPATRAERLPELAVELQLAQCLATLATAEALHALTASAEALRRDLARTNRRPPPPAPRPVRSPR